MVQEANPAHFPETRTTKPMNWKSGRSPPMVWRRSTQGIMTTFAFPSRKKTPLENGWLQVKTLRFLYENNLSFQSENHKGFWTLLIFFRSCYELVTEESFNSGMEYFIYIYNGKLNCIDFQKIAKLLAFFSNSLAGLNMTLISWTACRHVSVTRRSPFGSKAMSPAQIQVKMW